MAEAWLSAKQLTYVITRDPHHPLDHRYIGNWPKVTYTSKWWSWTPAGVSFQAQPVLLANLSPARGRFRSHTVQPPPSAHIAFANS